MSRSRAASSAIDLTVHPWIVAGIDCGIAGISYWSAFWVRSYLRLPFTSELMPSQRFFQLHHFWLLILGLQPALLFIFDAYHDIRRKRLREFVRPVFASSALQALILIAVYFYSGNLAFPRTVFPLYCVLNSLVVIGCRWVIKPASSQWKRRVLIVGTGQVTHQLLHEVDGPGDYGFEIVGIVSDGVPAGQLVGPYKVLGDRSTIPALVQEHAIEEVILTPESSWKDQLVDSISSLEAASPVRISVVPSVYEILIGRIRHVNLHDIPLMEVIREPNDSVASFLKRSGDVVISLIAVILLLPVWLIVALAVKCSDGGRVFYIQTRVGQFGKLFRIIKFRTMQENAEAKTGPVLASLSDPRLTPLGRWLRRWRIDETPQLLNVLKGDMTLVGPRPDRPEFVSRFTHEIPGYAERQKVKPGITGLAQIRGYYHTDPSIKLKYDLAYIYNHSLILDLVILAETLRVAMRRQGV
jgi:exopolysaccharide biosynthesis polyprenyl glycosylphosphotransferase